MTRVLLTGATGFIGSHVTWSLLSRGYEVRAFARQGSVLPWRHDSLTYHVGDIRDRHAVAAAIDGCDAVIHAAALYTLWSRDPKAIYDTNVTGTRNVLRAAVDAGIPRIVHTSSVSTTAFRNDRLATETDIGGPEQMIGHYKRTKFEAERIARRMAAAGAPIVIVNPTTPVGAADAKPTPTGKLVLDFMRGRLPAVVDTGLNFVDVTDVAEGHVLALEQGTPGNRYLLGNVDGNLTLIGLLQRLSALTGLPAPRLQVPHAVARLAADIDAFVEGILLKREPRISVEGAKMAHQKMWVDPTASVKELGLPQHPLDEALARAIGWFAEHGYALDPPVPSYPGTPTVPPRKESRR